MQKSSLITAATVIFSLAFAVSANAQAVPNATVAPAADAAASAVRATAAVTTAQEPIKTPSVLAAVRRGKKMLQDILAERLKTQKQPYAVKNGNTALVTFAVWDRATDAIAIVGAKKIGTDVTVTSGPNLPITVTYSDKLYSQYALPPESDSVVVGVIYPVVTQKTITKKKKIYEAKDTVYVPYAPEFYVPEMLSAGSDYLSFLIQDAYDELKTRGIKSRAFPDKLLVDVIDPYLVKSIAVIEHSDLRSLTQDESERAVGRFLVKLATNQEEAFDTSISSAGAAGLVQFIPSTYALMVKRRTDLGLIPDFRTGMADHKNAVKAQVAYLDGDLADMTAVRDLYVRDKAKAAEFLAASYNGGSTRVKRAYALFGDDWSKSYLGDLNRAKSDAATLKRRIASLQKQIDKGKDVKASRAALAKAKHDREVAIVKIATLQKSSLREETVGYVSKLKRTYAMFTAGYFATPRAPSGALPAVAAEVAQAPTPAEILASVAAPVGQICFSDGGCSAAN